MTATIETEELRGKITQDQYTIVLEDLFIGLTKSCPEGINFFSTLFKEPLENLQSSFFKVFGTSASGPGASTDLPAELYLTSQ